MIFLKKAQDLGTKEQACKIKLLFYYMLNIKSKFTQKLKFETRFAQKNMKAKKIFTNFMTNLGLLNYIIT